MSGHASTFEPKSRWGKWWDERLPIARLMHGSFVDFPTPRNLNYLWTFGGRADRHGHRAGNALSAERRCGL
jgi:ubiquinol-cytochrome c reductase cytochrome b/c1 subunit